MRTLFDVNVLIALLDGAHQHHALAWNWLDAHIEQGWASCPITQNGYVRIVSQSNYPNATTAYEAIGRLGAATRTEHHAFWPDSLSLLDASLIDRTRVHGPRQLTDVYLLALAVRHGGRLLSFDQRISLDAVRGARTEHLLVI